MSMSRSERRLLLLISAMVQTHMNEKLEMLEGLLSIGKVLDKTYQESIVKPMKDLTRIEKISKELQIKYNEEYKDRSWDKL